MSEPEAAKQPDITDFIAEGESATDRKDPRNDQIAELQDDLANEKSAHKEERFFWLLVLVIVIDLHFFALMRNWGGPVVVGAFEGIGLLIMADKCEVDSVMPLIDSILDSIRARKGRS